MPAGVAELDGKGSLKRITAIPPKPVKAND